MNEKKSLGFNSISISFDEGAEEQLIPLDKISRIRKTKSRNGDSWYIHIYLIDGSETITIGPLDYEKYKDVTIKEYLSNCML